MNLTDLPNFDSENGSTITSPELRRAGMSNMAMLLEDEKLPTDFPIHKWSEAYSRYSEYWGWFTGHKLDEERNKTPDGYTVSKFPLKINPVRDMSHKLAQLLIGEANETDDVLIETTVTPKHALFSDELPTESQKKKGDFYQNIVNEVWSSSNGNALLTENATLCQFLGGCVFQLEYKPWLKDSVIPIRVKTQLPDFVLPIWGDDPWNLLECWIVYRVDSATAFQQWGIEQNNHPYVIYVEHWTREHHSIYIDGKPLTAKYFVAGEKPYEITYNKRSHNFGFVPIVYIPRVREGSFYGSSFVPDIIGLMMELNGRAADWGTIVQQTAHRKWFGRNITGNIQMKQFDNGSWYSNLGVENPMFKNPPEMWAENPPNLGQYVKDNVDYLWTQLLRAGNLTPVHYGEDEGSQRSAETLQTRFWPSRVIAQIERTYWRTGMVTIAKMILNMCAALNIEIEGQKIPANISRAYNIRAEFAPMVARDRQALVAEIVALSTANRQSIYESLRQLGTVEDIDAEIDRIIEDVERISQMQNPIMQESLEEEEKTEESPTPQNQSGDNT